MYRIRFHGRGGQGLKTSSRILGTALFLDGFEVQDAPRYGAERRGAPIFAFVRADRRVIHERGLMPNPDLVVVSDESLVSVPSAGVQEGLSGSAVLLISSHEDAATWKDRLKLDCDVRTIEPTGREVYDSAACVGAAAALIGDVSEESLREAAETELERFRPEVREQTQAAVMAGYQAGRTGDHIAEGTPMTRAQHAETGWIELAAEARAFATPAVFDSANSVEVRTGLWRTVRPVIDHDRCGKCTWVCSGYCPDNAVLVDADGYPQIDLDHCKGCMICVAQCPAHVIVPVPATEAVIADHE